MELINGEIKEQIEFYNHLGTIIDKMDTVNNNEMDTSVIFTEQEE